MLHRFGEIFKKYPWYIVGAVVGVVILIWLMSRGGASADTQGGGIIAYGPSDTVVAVGAQTEMARINANAGTAQAQYNSELQQKLAAIMEDVNTNNNATNVLITQDNNTTALGLTALTTKSALDITNSNNAAAINITGVNVAGNVQMNKQDNDADVSVASAQAAAQTAAAAAAANAAIQASLSAERASSVNAAYHASEVAAQIESNNFIQTGALPAGVAATRSPPVFVSADQGNGAAAFRAPRG